MLKIAYVGNFRPEHSTENHIKKTLQAMGHQVIPLQEDELRVERMLAIIQSNKPDLLLYTRTWGFMGDGMRFLKQVGIPTASYHLDLYVGLQREAGLETDPFWRTDFVFTPDGDARSAKFFKDRNINHYYIKPGVFDQECYIAEIRPEFQHDVVFVGSYEYHSEWPYRKQLVDWLSHTYGQRFRRFGNPGADNKLCQGIRNHELNSLYASAKIVVGDSLCKNFDHTHYWSDRAYETLGRGGFLIHPFIEGMQEEFVTQRDLVFYEFANFEQLRKEIDFYLKNEDIRLKIQAQGHQTVKDNCTYKQRLTQALNIIAQHNETIKNKLLG